MPAPLQWPLGHSALARRAWRGLLYHSAELLTLCIRHPRTAGRVGALISAVHMRRRLPDPELRRRAWPDYPFGCKRDLFSSDFLPALRRPNVELVTEAIVRMPPEGPLTADGRRHDVDCVIHATGFRTNTFMLPMRVTGAAGLSIEETWSDGARAHLGITVSGFPSLFLMYGPNTNTSGGSIPFFLEAQGAGLHALDARFTGTAWTSCSS
ncbi:hypothetical protein ABZ896_02565 [Streptomyces sp. NPDC047072]|uniref:hypothetical protein n=1 Tax=Streptomyces sp. NPDC047072 TaxID=3154809 RepID=UPI0033F7C55F